MVATIERPIHSGVYSVVDAVALIQATSLKPPPLVKVLLLAICSDGLEMG